MAENAKHLLLVDDDLHPVEGDGMPNPSTRCHRWVYRVRPDVHCILHTHPPHTSALSMLGEDLAEAGERYAGDTLVVGSRSWPVRN